MKSKVAKNVVNLFIDTNIFLGFYQLTQDDLEELRKLTVLIKDGRIRLLLPQQVVDEFYRNRDSAIANGLKLLRNAKIDNQFPQFCHEYDEYKVIRKAMAVYKDQKSVLINKLQKDVEERKLKGDEIIDELFSQGDKIDVTSEIVDNAILRHRKGNPPGKKDSYGDSINWICLLESVPQGENLSIISDDSDYASATNVDKINPFLYDEWTTNKRSEVFLFKRLSAYFSENFPKIKLASELEKELAIEAFVNSQNFNRTHSTIRQLRRYTEFNKGQVDDILRGSIENGQISRIVDDNDVKTFLFEMYCQHVTIAEPHVLREFYGQFNHILNLPDPPKV